MLEPLICGCEEERQRFHAICTHPRAAAPLSTADCNGTCNSSPRAQKQSQHHRLRQPLQGLPLPGTAHLILLVVHAGTVHVLGLLHAFPRRTSRANTTDCKKHTYGLPLLLPLTSFSLLFTRDRCTSSACCTRCSSWRRRSSSWRACDSRPVHSAWLCLVCSILVAAASKAGETRTGKCHLNDEMALPIPHTSRHPSGPACPHGEACKHT